MLKPKAVVFFLLFAFIFGFGLLQAGVLFAEEEPEEPVEEPNPPRIESINPNFGQAGDLITITGRYLKDVVSIRIGNITVTEGDVNWRTPSATAVGLVIPDGLTGVVEIEIISRDGHQAKLESAFTFSGEIDPVVSSISPNIGGLSGGTSVTISGENFKQNIGPDGNPVLPQVRFGEVMARSVSLFNTREITAITPGAIAEGKVDVWLKNPVEGAEWVKTDLEFEYVNEGKLARILNITPNSGTMLGGTEITVQGVNFPASLEEAAVDLLIGRVPVERGSIEIEPYGFYDEDGNFVQYFEEGNPIYIINARTDQSQLSGEQDVELLIDWTEGPKAGRSEIALFEKGFTYYYPSTKPVIERVVNIVTQKDVGPVGGGHEIEIRGSDFRSGAKVFFGDKEARIIGSVTLNLIRVELPPSDFSGQVDVLVVNYIDDFPTGQFLFENGFTYRRTGMEISSVTPKEVSTVGIRNFTITGHNFNEDIKRLTKVYFEVEKPDPMHPGETFIDQEPLTIIYFDPQADGTLLVAESPTNPSSGLKYLVVENSYGRVISKEPVLFYPPDIKPEIHTVTQAVYEGDQPPSPRGPTAGGTRFIINGNYLTTGTRVFVGDVEAAVDERLSDFTRLEVVSPPGTPGWKDVRVLSLTGNTATMEANPDAEEGYKGFYYYSEPKINNVSPNRGSILGDNIITITGEQFYPGAVVNFGYFDEANKFVSVTEEVRELIVLDSKTIKLRLPQLKEGEILRPEGYLVQVVNTDNRSTTWAKNFQYRIPDLEKKIKIHSVNPAIGHVDGGTKVAIRGENFHPDAVVHFGWEKADIQAINDREIVVIIPPNLAGEYVVTVSNYADTGTDTWESFEYLDPSSFPKIMGVFPEVGPAKGGTNIIITGIGFWNGAKVYIGGRIAEDVEIYHTYITAKTPASDKAGPVDVMVINPDGGADTLFDGFTYKFPDSEPKITSVNPNKIPATGGSIVTIKGEDFRKEVVVYFGTEKAEILEFIEPDTIIVKAPPYTLGEEGIVDVTVLNRDGGIAQSLDESQQIHYYSAKSEPIIDSITPKRGPAAGGTRVIIEGDGFSSKGVKVYFGGREATLAEDAPLRYDRLEVITPPGVPGSVVHVTVMNTHQDALGSATLSNAYTYDASKPVIDSIAPNQATYLGGTLITIRGSGFTKAGAEVYIGEWQGEEVRVIDSETITFVTARIAERPEDLTELRWWDVKVINADGIEVVKEKAFRYLFPDSEPRIISISPEEGSTLGGMPLTLIGTDFRQRAKVVIGGKEAEILSIDDSPGAGNAKIIVKTPAHTPGEKDVTVINYEGAISNSKTFTYVTPLSFPEIFELDPKYGSTLGDTEVIITGIGFKAGAKVWFGMYEAGEVEFIDYKTLKVLTPPGNEGMADVLVLNEDMGQAVLEKGFRYVKSKEFVVNSITPDEGSALGGTAITIKGGPFEVGVQVYIGAELALEVNRPDVETILAITPPGDLGWQEVKVKNPDGGFVIIENGFYYFKPRTAPETPGWIDTVRRDRDTIEVKWEPSEFANYYEIWISYSRNGKYIFLDETAKTVYYATGLDLNQSYYFQIRAINELGVSGFSYYSYTRTGAGSEKEADLIPKEVAIQANKEQATATIATRDNLLSTAYRIDFTPDKYQSAAKKVVRISQDALSGLNWPLTIELPDLQISVPPISLLPGLWGQSEAYAELTIMDLGQQEAEKALKGLPKGSRILSPVYSIEWQSVQDTKKTSQTVFYQQVNLTFKYNQALTTGKEISLFTYSPSADKWVNTGAAHMVLAPQLLIGINNTGRFVLVEH